MILDELEDRAAGVVTTAAVVVAGAFDVVLNSAELMIALSDQLLPIVSILVGRVGEALGVPQSLALRLLVIVAIAFLIHQITRLREAYNDETS